MLFLQENGVSTSFAAKIYKQYGNESIPTVKANPYRLADDIWGIGFRTAGHDRHEESSELRDQERDSYEEKHAA